MIFVELECVATGERRFVDEDAYTFSNSGSMTPLERATFWWTEGNGGCDCNRERAFRRVPEDPECTGDRFRLIRVWEADEPAERSPLCDDMEPYWVVRKAWP